MMTKFLKCFYLAGLVLVIPSATVLSSSPSANDEKATVLTSVFDPQKAQWNIAWPERIAQYDLIYYSPPIDPFQGMALGNGEIGALMWCEDSKIIIAVNKSDLWDDAAFERFHNWRADEEDKSTTLRHACRIIIDFHQPVFSTLYLSDFKGRLSLADASAHMQTTTPFGEINLCAFVDRTTDLLVLKLSQNFYETVPIEIAIERYGSRTYSHWYSQINRDAAIGLDGTEAGVAGSTIFITQKLGKETFAVGGVAVQHDCPAIQYTRDNSRRSSMLLRNSGRLNAQLLFSVTSPMVTNPLEPLGKTLDTAGKTGLDSLFHKHTKIWQEIWLRSFMDYGDDYLNALWHVTQYYAISSQGGRYPGRFNNGLWAWNRDVQNWNYYFHWNQQQLYWPLNAAGHHELICPYLNYRFNSLRYAKKDAQEFFKSKGAYISDVTDRRGFNSLNELANHTPVAEIALDFWRQYRYTCDETFLKDKALPFIIEAARFYVSLLEKKPDGLYHAREGTGYEGWIKLYDGLTELVYARALLTTALAACAQAGLVIPEIKQWQEITAHCAALPIVTADPAAIRPVGDHYIFAKGFCKDQVSFSDAIFAAGWGIKEKQWLTVFSPTDDSLSHNGLKLLDGIFPTVTCAPVFPSNLIGLAQKSSYLFDVMTTTARLYSPEGTGWDPTPIVFARLGLADELARDLQRFPQRWQIYCNGWGHWGMEGLVNKDAEEFFRTNQVKAVGASASKEKFPLPMWPFRHMSMESMSVLATAMNESAMQSHDGIIRIAPAFVKNRNGRFTLHGQDGFVVSFEIRQGEVLWICIQSLFGKTCRLQIPWKEFKIQSNFVQVRIQEDKDIISFKTQKREILLLTPGSAKITWNMGLESPVESKVRHHASGKVKLGMERMY